MNITDIYVNLPVKDVQKTREFWTKLGFSINEQFSDDKAICVVMKENHIYTMFLKEEFFQTFTNRPFAKGDTTQVLLAIGVNSRDEVDGMVKTAIENGGSKYSEPVDYGWMYQSSFADINGHQWEVMHGDVSQIPAE
ncbi:putative lactoylglutathione lyase [Chryseobacterium bernardetii]|jgi:predicted lactoylglutathione lyase|uniref:VOC domain-containing protein n=3 Tax=Chryseobacterium TaxID=59732 RepID=A0A543EKW5_9FLAO|nr:MULTISPECIES: VOC family protein [Chryseobacterium]MCP1299340.1 VOC family protein [Chryseobacterium sp. S0630]MDR6372215.1 putative lactoylglutathione lyase [Chryseobacterium vietnamense]MDR6442401.1 putative lactoylglutathione lyase [Chryseobacterium bernardetii]MDR6458615.1 putative lactoylglutathione lyase [Chryseobacterium vietnamense]MDR6489766.1 putative lactoylglutathione lyase [Chryseobacterium vietnamense]